MDLAPVVAPMPSAAFDFSHANHFIGAVLTLGIWVPFWVVSFCSRRANAHRRWVRLVGTYGQHVAMLILERKVQQGMLRAAVVEAFGEPFEEEEDVMKSKTRHVLVYRRGPKGGARFKVKLENGFVVGWHQK
jgi:hypothetical protein